MQLHYRTGFTEMVTAFQYNFQDYIKYYYYLILWLLVYITVISVILNEEYLK